MERLKVMGILNTTPDSFSDGGKYNSVTQHAPAVTLKLLLTLKSNGQCPLLKQSEQQVSLWTYQWILSGAKWREQY